jgi:LmbE family N-acetylglucosaminyl deacetylase
MRVLAVGAHPDDIELLCGGTLAKYRSQGHEVFICHIANGDLGHTSIPRKKLAKIRAREAQEAGKVIGAKVIGLDISDLEIFPELKVRRMLTDVVRRARPDVVITHSPDDYMPDHVLTSELVFGATFESSVPQVKTKHKFHPTIPVIYHMDTLAGVNFLPTEYVDISDVMQEKTRMLSCHRSQLTWMSDHDRISFVDFMEITAKFRGIQCGVKYAECFMRRNAWPRIPYVRLLP